MIKKYISAVALVGIFTISLPIASAQSISQITPVSTGITASTLPIQSIPNNPLSIILPLVEKAGPNTPHLASSDITASFTINVVANKGAMKFVFGLSAGAAIQNIMTQGSDKIAKTQTQSALNYNIDQKLLSLIGIKSGVGSIGFQTRMIKSATGEDIYFKITSVSPDLYNQIFNTIAVAKRLKLNTWYSISVPAKVFSAQTTKTDSMLTYQEQLEATKLVFSNVTLDRDYGIDTTTAVPSRHLTLGLSEQGILNIFNYVSANDERISNKLNSNGDSIGQEVFTQLKDVLMMPEVRNLLNNVKIDIWVGVNDSRIYKLNLHGNNIVINPNSFVSKSASAAAPVDSVLVNFQLGTEVKSLNKASSIVAPKPVLSFETFIKNLQGDSYQKAADTSVKSSFVSLRAQAEIYYDMHNSTYTGMCTDASRDFGYSFNSLKKSYGTNCGAYGQNYLITLMVAPNDYLCIDNTGNYTEGKTNRAFLGTATCK